MSSLLRNSHIFVAQKSEEFSMKSMQQSIYFVITTKMGPFMSIIQHIFFEKFIWCPSKYHEMKMLLPVTSANKWPESDMLTVNIAKEMLVQCRIKIFLLELCQNILVQSILLLLLLFFLFLFFFFMGIRGISVAGRSIYV